MRTGWDTERTVVSWREGSWRSRRGCRSVPATTEQPGLLAARHSPTTSPPTTRGAGRRSKILVVVELGVFVFPGRHAAKQALDEVRERELAWIEDVAVVERPKRGPVSVHSTWAQNEADRKGLGLGALTG